MTANQPIDGGLVISSFRSLLPFIANRTDQAEQTAEMGLLNGLAEYGEAALALAQHPLSSGTSAFGTVALVARAMLEAGGLFVFLFKNQRAGDELTFILKAMEIASIYKRQRFTRSVSPGVDGQQRLQDEQQNLQILLRDIRQNPNYSALSAKQQVSVENGSYKLYDLSSVSEHLGLTPDQNKTIYSFLSSFTHSDYLGMRYFYNPNDPIRLTRAVLTRGATAQALLLHLLAQDSRWTKLKHEIDKNNALAHEINLLCTSATA